MSIHLRPTAPIAADALLPGDPGRALMLAQELLVEPKMSNHHRGLWGYFGETAEGRPLTIQATGIGGPSAAIVLSELAEQGLERAIRVGTCAAFSDELDAGSLAVVDEALAGDGTSRSLGAEGTVRPDAVLTSALRAAVGDAPAIRVATADLFYLPGGGTMAGAQRADGAAALEMEAAPLFTLGERLGVALACVLAVTTDSNGLRPDPERLAEAEREMGRAAAGALGD